MLALKVCQNTAESCSYDVNSSTPEGTGEGRGDDTTSIGSGLRVSAMVCG